MYRTQFHRAKLHDFTRAEQFVSGHDSSRAEQSGFTAALAAGQLANS